MKSTARTVGLVMIIMVLSRLMSLISIQVYMAFFGTDNLELNIYTYATQLPNIIFTCFGTALSTVVIPIFAGYMGTGDKQRAFKFADNILSLSVVFTIGLTILGLLTAGIFPYFTDFRENGYGYAVMALRIMFPVMIFYGLNYVFQGILQSMGRFNAPAFVSVPSSLIVILYVVFLGNRYKVTGLLAATFIGLAMQALILVPPILKTEYRYKMSFDYKSEDIKSALRLIPPVLIGTSAYQLNMLYNVTVSANFKNMVTLLTYAQYLILYSILAFIYSVTAVVFPKFTMLSARNDMDGFKQSLQKVLKSILYFLIPATAGFIAIRYQLVDLLAGWGKVTPENVLTASRMLGLYAIGIAGLGIKEVIDRAFYSLKDTKKPAYNGVVIMAVNIGASLLLIRFIGVLGIPLAYSLSALTGGAVLLVLIRRKIGPFGGKGLAVSVLKIAAASIIMLAVIMPLISYLSRLGFGTNLIGKAVRLFIPTAAGALIYYASTFILKVEEAVDVLEKLKTRLGLTRRLS